jgi:hypothetical protein
MGSSAYSIRTHKEEGMEKLKGIAALVFWNIVLVLLRIFLGIDRVRERLTGRSVFDKGSVLHRLFSR